MSTHTPNPPVDSTANPTSNHSTALPRSDPPSTPSSAPSSGPWYREGLRFTCTGCGACCTGKGRVWLSEEDIYQIAEALQSPPHEVVERYITRQEGRWALNEDPQNGDCVFLKEHRCTLYEGRPRQCRTFPWWPSTLKSEARWAEVKRVCEGVEAEGAPLVPLAEIEATLAEERAGRTER